MVTAAKILIIGGLASLLFAFIMGFVLSRARLADPNLPQERLLNVHVVTLWEGFMLLGLVWAVALSDLSAGLETLAAVLLVVAATLQAAASFFAWRGHMENLFADTRSPVYLMAASNAVIGLVGLAILVIGAVKGL